MTAGGPGLNRRAFLARGVAAAVAAGFAPLGFGAESMPWRVSSGAQRVVVAGAGLAGLEAALELVEAGHVVTVFEARSRPGGRVRTLREPFADGLTAEAGAMSIPESHELTLDTARRFGLPLLDAVRPAPKTLAWMRGRRMVVPAGEEPPWPVELTPRERSLGAAGMNREYWGRELEIAAGHADSLDWPPAELAGLDRLSLADLWRRNGASEAAIAVLRFAPTDLLGDGAESFSALNGLRETALRRPGGRFWIEGGNERLPQAFAARLGGRIRYGAELVRIAMTDLPIQLVMHATAAQPGPRGILDTYITGAEARRLAALEPARRLAEVVAQASRLYPELPAHFEGGTSVCWDDEPWTRGAYAYFAPGEVGTLLPHVARPEGRVHFAGDHTSSRPGWMQGALSSGLRAAAEVAAG